MHDIVNMVTGECLKDNPFIELHDQTEEFLRYAYPPMCKNMLENLHRMLVFIRHDIQNEKNVEYVKLLASAFRKGLSNAETVNCLLNSAPELKSHLLPGNSEIFDVKKEDTAFIENTLYRVQAKLREKDFNTAYDIVDMLHVFPHVILSNDKKKREEYWKVYVNRLQEK